jgi:hypothetical protein
MRLVILVAAAVALSACAIPDDPGSRSDQSIVSSLPQWITGLPGDGPEFGVTGVAGEGGAAASGDQVAARHADQICTLGHQTLEQGTAPAAPGAYSVARIRCNPYRPSL